MVALAPSQSRLSLDGVLPHVETPRPGAPNRLDFLQGITQPFDASRRDDLLPVRNISDVDKPIYSHCPSAKPILANCGHGNERWIMVPCGDRECAYCGPKALARYSRRIDYAIELNKRAGHHGAKLTLTFASPVYEDADSANKALGKLQNFIKKLRRKNRGMQYCWTKELTKNGRVHFNLLCLPWVYIDKWKLAAMWGQGYVHVKDVPYVDTANTVGGELTKSYQITAGAYMAKASQQVPASWGRRIQFSQKFPAAPPRKHQRVGKIDYNFSPAVWRLSGFYDAEKRGLLVQTAERDLALPFAYENETPCTCFEYRPCGKPRCGFCWHYFSTGYSFFAYDQQLDALARGHP